MQTSCFSVCIVNFEHVKVFSGSLLRAKIARNHLLFQICSNFVHFCQNFQIFSPFFPFLIFLYILALFLKNRTHALTF